MIENKTKLNTKICANCNEEKPLSNFFKNSSRKDNLDPYCKNCRNEYNKQKKVEEPVDEPPLPAWAEKLFSRFESLEEQVNNNIPMSADPPIAYQQPEPMNEDARFLKDFLERFALPKAFVDIQLRKLNLRNNVLPSVAELSSDVSSFMKNFKFANFLSENYNFELLHRYQNYNQNYNQPVAYGDSFYRNPGSQYQQPQQNTTINDMDRFLAFYKLINEIKPQQQGVSFEQMVDLIERGSDKREIAFLRENKGGKTSENDVNMEEVKQKYKIENKKLDDSYDLKQNIYNKIGIILSAIPGAIGLTQEELIEQAKQNYPGYPDNMPDRMQQQLPMEEKPTGMEIFPPDKMFSVECSFCKTPITFPASSRTVTCGGCGKKQSVSYEAPDQLQQKEPIQQESIQPIQQEPIQQEPVPIQQPIQQPQHVEQPSAVDEKPVDEKPVPPPIDQPPEPIQPKKIIPQPIEQPSAVDEKPVEKPIEKVEPTEKPVDEKPDEKPVDEKLKTKTKKKPKKKMIKNG